MAARSSHGRRTRPGSLGVATVSARREERPLTYAGAGLLALNAIGAAAAAGFAAAGLIRPDYVELAASNSALTRFWAASSAVRTWALTLPLLASMARHRTTSSELLFVAALVQLGDAAIGLQRGNRRMTVAPAVMGTVHILSARALARPLPPASALSKA